MKVLMFGWEFPPHILGGLGTASYGLTKGMSQQEDMEITFCIPKPWGDEDQSFLRIIGMNSTPIVWGCRLGICQRACRLLHGSSIIF